MIGESFTTNQRHSPEDVARGLSEIAQLVPDTASSDEDPSRGFGYYFDGPSLYRQNDANDKQAA